MKNMGKRIEQKRIEKHLTQEELGAKLNPPVTRQSISRWERGGTADIKRSYIEQMAKIFNVDAIWILGYEDSTEVSLTYEAPGKESVRLMVDKTPIIGNTSKIVELYQILLQIKPEYLDMAIQLLKPLTKKED